MKKKSIVVKVFRIIGIIVISLLAIISSFTFYHMVTDPSIIISSYTVYADIENPICIVQLSDLHNAEIDNNNKIITDNIADINPDLIIMSGDMINRDETDYASMANLLQQLSEISTVYYGYGNHEQVWDETIGIESSTSMKEIVLQNGGIPLNLDYYDIRVNGNNIRIGGYMGYYHFPGMFEKNRDDWVDDWSFFDDFEDTTNFKILINHIPTQWIDWGHNDDYDVDLVFSGHYHGGQWVFPIIGPVYAPYVEWLPENVKGCFIGEKATCILSSGLGNEYKYIPRINNPPEIIVVELQPTTQ